MGLTARLALGVEYDGSAFSGWQVQHGARTVQGELEAALSSVADEPVRVVCAGRTDAGVHARGQVVHVDTGATRAERSWVLGANAHLPADVNVLWARPVDESFHARYSARSRTYRYTILNRPYRSALTRLRALWVPLPLDVAAMRAAATRLLGEHDFSAFRSSACQSKTPVRRVTALDVARHGERIDIVITANAFLHNMVRIVAGTLVAVGRGDAHAGWIDELLEHRDRTRSGYTAPPHGLYLERVDYPADFALPTVGAG